MTPLFANGYFIKASPAGQNGSHIIGGACTFANAISPNSGRPLLQVASICLADPKLPNTALQIPVIPLLYGWTCALCESTFAYKIQHHNIEILQYLAGPAHDDFPYANYPQAFPAIKVELCAIPAATQGVIHQLNSASDMDTRSHLSLANPKLSTPRHQLGGEPYFLQGYPAATPCPQCKDHMYFLAAFGNDTLNGSKQGFVNNDFVQLIYEICPSCTIVAVNNYAD